MGQSEVNRHSVAAAGGAWVGLLVGASPMISATVSNFMRPLAETFGVGRSSISAALSVTPLVVAAAVPVCGWAMDRFGLRRILLPGVVLFGLVLLALSRATNVWVFALLQIPLGIALSMHSSVAYAKVVSEWFDRWRGLVLGLIVALGAGVGQTSMPVIAQELISRFGWQKAYVGIALIVLCFGLPLIALLVREPGHSRQSAGKSTPSAELPGASVGQACRTVTFWLIFLGIMCGSLTLLGTLQHGVPLITEHGYDVRVATRALSFAFAGVVAGQLTSGALVNEINTSRVIVPYFFVALIGLWIVHTVHVESGPTVLFIGSLMLGLGLGGEVAQNAYLVSRYFGLKSFGSIYGLTFAASNIGIAAGTFLMGRIHDLHASYAPARPFFISLMAVSVVCVALLGPYTYARTRR